MVKLKIGWSFYQVATLIPAVYHVTMPKEVDEFLSVLRVTIEVRCIACTHACIRHPHTRHLPRLAD